MKIYYEPPDKHDEVGNVVAAGLSTLSPELSKIITPMVEKTADLQYQLAVASFETFKYRTMWALRYLEKEINDAGGMIIVKDTGKIDLRGFTAEMDAKIYEHFERFVE